MSLVPDFELGLWNAWILIIPLIIYWFSGIKFLFSKRMSETPSLKRRKDWFGFRSGAQVHYSCS